MKNIGLLDSRKYAMAISDAFTFVDAGGASYPQIHGGSVKDAMGILQKVRVKEEDVIGQADTIQLWDDYLKRAEKVLKEHYDRAYKRSK